MKVCTDQQRLSHFMNREIGLPFSDDTRYIGFLRTDHLSIAGSVAYNCWLEDSVFMHVAFTKRVVTRVMLREAFMYPFQICKKKRVYGMTPITSQRASVFAERLGFRVISRTPDLTLLAMSREECRWINDATISSGSDSRATSSLQPH